MTMPFDYGFRVDPMSFVENDTSFDAALVRTVVFRRPTECDKKAIAETLAQLNVFERRDSEGAAHTSGPPFSVNSENLLRLARGVRGESCRACWRSADHSIA